MNLYETAGGSVLEEWSSCFQPATMVLRDLKTGRELREVSLVAAEVNRTEKGKPFPAEVQRYLAAGAAAQEYGRTPDTVVFSPFRRGQIANYGASVYMLRSFLKELSPGIQLWKPLLWVWTRERMTEVERRAFLDAGVQAGARKVLLRQGPLCAAALPEEPRNGLLFYIEPRDE